ncbi:MAG: DUF2207 domain-containing protein [Clostridia bacterium]|nr:DUF2207 domain-containing protein [Clostridia bacterium]
MKKRVVALIIALTAVFVCLAVFLPRLNINYSSDYYRGPVDDGYSIVSASYDITVSENRSALVTERLTVKFYERSSGIVRYLPTNSGEQYSGISLTGDTYYVEQQDDFLCVYTGEDYSGKYSNGDEVTYVLSYTIVPPTKTINNTNYKMNVVPFGWDTSQNDVTVSITFPYEIKDVLVYVGSYGTTYTTTNYQLSEDGKGLTMSKSLMAYNGVTIDAELGKKFNVNFSLPGILAIISVMLLVIACVMVKLFFVKDTFITPIINAFSPTDGGEEIDPALMGYLIDNKCESSDVTSMIFYFASKGYIQLEMDGDEFTLVKLKELPPDAPKHQTIIFQGLFRSGQRVTSTMLQNKFYTDIAAANIEIKAKYDGKLYDKKAKRKAITLMVASAAVLAIVISVCAIRVNLSLIFGEMLTPILNTAILILIGFSFGRFVYNNKNKFSQKKIALSVLLIGVGAILIGAIFSFGLLYGIFPFYGRMIILVGAQVIGFVCGLMRKKTDYYTALTNDIVGFKEFLLAAEKDRLEKLVEENPQYYYDILPYANVLGVSKVMQDKFETIESVPPPTYYYGYSVFDIVIFNRIMRRSYVAMSVAMASRPSGSSHSGGGGGGFGGGFGGGGFGGGGGGRR